VFTPDTKLAEEFDELAPKQGEKVISKNYPSSFAKTDLDEYLKELGDAGKKVVLTGYMAHVCVSTTARAGAELGYDVVLAEGAIGDRDIPGGLGGKELTDVVLKELGDAFGTVLKAQEVQG
jgi:nicotinamidase-related amidase